MTQKQDIIKSVVVLSLICLVVSAVLAIVNAFTAPVSAANAAARENAARLAVMEGTEDFDPVEGIEFAPEILNAFSASDAGGATTGYVFTVRGKGFGGDITVMCAIDMEGKIINCSALDVSGETKTLGGRVADASYTQQFAGSDETLDGVDTISGATVTSRAFEDCVKKAYEAYALVREADA